MAEVFTKSISDYLPMQNVKCANNQRVTQHMVQIWFKLYGNNFHVAGTKTDFVFLR